ncbi:HAD family hydrolase [Candidatus Enterococcus ferrettii]|uniref:HAD family phosphatase n=1 Tax=Candidatus Enterococcus ferrettii TaxID=2815324 RepID=A0ABV0EQA3_9ENTE|nr:HAD family phosphatase [Enterococcus sp. 665A]MBO1340993.1 HAD family phosphatase [Enterococcus sp. 665A]
MIKNIVFDLGNVLVNYEPTKFITKFTNNSLHQKFLLENIFLTAEWIDFDRGTITKDEIARRALKKAPAELKEIIPNILATWYQEIVPIPEMEAIVKQLKDQGYKLYVLSNAPDDFYKYEKNIPALKYMDGIFVTADWKIIKPEAQVYYTFCHHFQLIPSQCIFLDDLPVNVSGARAIGMESFVFRKNLFALKEYLIDFDIEITI